MLIAQPREIHLEDPPDFHVLSPHFSRRVVDTAGDRPRCIDLDGRCFHDVLCDRLLDRLPFFSHFLTLVRRPFCVSLLCAYLPACVVLSCPWELARRPPLRKLASTSSRRATSKEAKDELRNRSSSPHSSDSLCTSFCYFDYFTPRPLSTHSANNPHLAHLKPAARIYTLHALLQVLLPAPKSYLPLHTFIHAQQCLLETTRSPLEPPLGRAGPTPRPSACCQSRVELHSFASIMRFTEQLILSMNGCL